VVTDKTVLYATSGGQLHDNGYIEFNDNKFLVEDVIKGPNGQHFALINTDGIEISLKDKVNVYVDEQFRKLVAKNHSAEHLLEYVMKHNISSSIKQMGAFKSSEKMTFDYQHTAKLTDEQIEMIEKKINDIIAQKIPVETVLTTIEEAKQMGAVAHFEEVYAKIKEKLRLVCFKGNLNLLEICGGTHVKELSDIEQFMIVKCESKGSGMWRVECITSKETIATYVETQMSFYSEEIQKIQKDITSLKIKNEELNKLIVGLNLTTSVSNLRVVKKQLEKIKTIYDAEYLKIAKDSKKQEINDLKNSEFVNVNILKYFITYDKDIKTITSALIELSNENKENIFLNININAKLQYTVASANENINANALIQEINTKVEGNGGGNKQLARGGSDKVKKLDELVEFLDT
jgi:alanyl-tRNA synthetase